MTQVIYIDILVIVNVYIGYALLRLTGIICSLKVNRLRLVLSALLQGAYSLVILLPELSVFIKLPVRAAACAVFVLAAFRLSTLRKFLRLYAAFFAVSSVFAGLMLAVWLLFSPGSMSYGNGTVYFGINTLTLAVMTVVCYAIVRIVYLIIDRRTPKSSVYALTINAHGNTVSCEALLDTGNSLCDVFSGLPVIVIDSKLAEKLLGELMPGEPEQAVSTGKLPAGFRIIPCSTVGGESLMAAFRPERVILNGLGQSLETDSVYIAVAASGIRGGFGAVVGPKVFESAEKIKAKGE